MSRDEVWARFMAASLTAAVHDGDQHLAQTAERAGFLADYALHEYEKRLHKANHRDDVSGQLHFEPIYSFQSSSDSTVKP